MRYGPDDSFWIVTDPTAGSREADICFETTLAGLERRFRDGLTAVTNLTLFTDENEAKVEALGRVATMRAKQAIAQAAEGGWITHTDRLVVLDGDGTVLFEADLGESGPAKVDR